ncbi:MAG TPA: adenylate/guanylate cyclase domain-containing protein [Acidimicrobiales bacterium]|nr:adenylate/guanylate cyclase domain-containing protein [Acidimicrobiales bacterium]
MLEEVDWGRQGRKITAALGSAHLAGALFVFAYLSFLAPSDTVPNGSIAVDIGLFVAYAVVAFPLTGWWCSRLASSDLSWISEEPEPTDDQRQRTLELPGRMAAVTAAPWAAAAVFFGAMTAISGHTAVRVATGFFTTLDGGLVSCTIGFLLLERLLRPAIAMALSNGASPRRRVIGVRLRLLVTWALASAVPLAGLLLLPLARRGASLHTDIGPAVVALSLAGLVAGFVITIGNARTVGEPISDVRKALQAVQEGRLDVQVTVDRAGDLGELQSGVNRMVEGLRERQRLADLFGKHVGTEVAQQAIEQGTGVDSEQREASVLFVDLIGSTALAEVLPPHEVVRTLNAYFDAVVRVVSAAGGWVNKFEGDGALCVFGAPATQPDHAARALRAARALHEALAELAHAYPGLDAAIGVSSGTLVAGNVGTETRYEYTVIGRPVNEAARLTDLAKGRTGRVLASQGAADRSGDELERWASLGTVALRGQSTPVVIYEPVEVREPVS